MVPSGPADERRSDDFVLVPDRDAPHRALDARLAPMRVGDKLDRIRTFDCPRTNAELLVGDVRQNDEVGQWETTAFDGPNHPKEWQRAERSDAVSAFAVGPIVCEVGKPSRRPLGRLRAFADAELLELFDQRGASCLAHVQNQTTAGR
jgi:hypothetical protein